MPEFGRPQFSTVFENQIQYFLSKYYGYPVPAFGRPQLSTGFTGQVRFFLLKIHGTINDFRHTGPRDAFSATPTPEPQTQNGFPEYPQTCR